MSAYPRITGWRPLLKDRWNKKRKKKKKRIDGQTDEHVLGWSRLQELEQWPEGMRTAMQWSIYLAKQRVLWFGDIWGQVTLAGIPALTRILSELGDSPFQLWTPVLNWQMENIFTEVFLAGSQKRFKYLTFKKKVLISCAEKLFFLFS